VEKYLKARLEEGAVAFPKTHDLERLLDLAVTMEPLWVVFRPVMATLTDYAVEVRYPGRTVSAPQARKLMLAAAKVRERIRESLGLPRSP
jgi:HEPN domain-containing protein